MNKIKLQLKGRWCVHAIYKDVIHDPRLSLAGKGVYVALMAFLSPGAECAYPSRDHLTRILNVNRKTLNRYTQELIQLGLLEVEQDKHVDPKTGKWYWGTNLYTLRTRIKPVKEGAGDKNEQKPQQSSVDRFLDHQDLDHQDLDHQKLVHKVQTLGKRTHQESINTTKTASGGDAGDGSVPPTEELSSEAELREAAHTFLHRTYRYLVSRLRGQEVPITEITVQHLQAFFKNNPGWYPCDVAYTVFKGLLAAEKWPKPPQGHDAWFYSRMVDVPQWFTPNRDGTSKIIHTARENGYTGGRTQEDLEAEIRNFLKACA
jgi:hypothetical protein